MLILTLKKYGSVTLSLKAGSEKKLNTGGPCINNFFSCANIDKTKFIC